MNRFHTAMMEGVLTADGAMGSMVARSLPNENPMALARDLLEVNLTYPDVVRDIHMQYIHAGAQVIYTNSFGASQARLDRLGLGPQASKILSESVKLAREARDACGGNLWIAGSISPLSTDWLLDTNPSAEQKIAEFAQQVELLLDRGADLIALETFSKLDQLLLAIQAVRRVSATTELVASWSFDEQGELGTGENGEAAARLITDTGEVQILGVNCSVGPRASLSLLESVAAGTALPLSILPNAGFAQRLGGRVLYPDMSRAYYEAFTREALQLGVRLVGGCCGTTPEQIRVIAETVAATHDTRASRPVVHQVEPPAESAEVRLQASGPKPSKLERMLQAKQFVRTLQIDPQRGPADTLNREVVVKVIEEGLVDILDINSSGGSARQDSLQIAAGIERLGLETLPHITPRDASLQGVLSQVLGAYDWGGIRNVLVIIGDPPRGDLYAEAKGVYQVDSIGLVRALARLRIGRKINERVSLQPFDLGIGVALNQNSPDLELELKRLEEKIEAGANFVMTQPFFAMDDWNRFRDQLAGRFDIPMMLGIWPLISAKQAQRINENVAGVVIPPSVCQKLETAGAQARDVGFDLAASFLAELESTYGAAGAYLVAPFKQPWQGLEVFARLGTRPDAEQA